MATHQDSDHGAKTSFLDELRIRAEVMGELGKNAHATAHVLERSTHKGMEVCRKVNDRQDILRISIGGLLDQRKTQYCNFRGDQGKCIQLLERALAALRRHDG